MCCLGHITSDGQGKALMAEESSRVSFVIKTLPANGFSQILVQYHFNTFTHIDFLCSACIVQAPASI